MMQRMFNAVILFSCAVWVGLAVAIVITAAEANAMPRSAVGPVVAVR